MSQYEETRTTLSRQFEAFQLVFFSTFWILVFLPSVLFLSPFLLEKKQNLDWTTVAISSEVSAPPSMKQLTAVSSQEEKFWHYHKDCDVVSVQSGK